MSKGLKVLDICPDFFDPDHGAFWNALPPWSEEHRRREAIELYANNQGEPVSEIVEDKFEEAWEGVWANGGDFVYMLYRDDMDGMILPKLPDWATDAIDWQAAWDTCVRFYYWTAPAAGGGIHVFREN
jgi:hypothetical protein